MTDTMEFLRGLSDEGLDSLPYAIKAEKERRRDISDARRKEDALNECQAWYGSDDVCGLPPNSPIHTTSPIRHAFVPKTASN